MNNIYGVDKTFLTFENKNKIYMNNADFIYEEDKIKLTLENYAKIVLKSSILLLASAYVFYLKMSKNYSFDVILKIEYIIGVIGFIIPLTELVLNILKINDRNLFFQILNLVNETVFERKYYEYFSYVLF